MTTDENTHDPVPLRLAPSAAEAGAVQTHPALAPAASPAHVTATTAEALIVSLRAVRRVGPGTALVLAAIQAGLQDYASIASATGFRRSEVRVHWARLARSGYPLPSHETATGAAASAPVGADNHQ